MNAASLRSSDKQYADRFRIAKKNSEAGAGDPPTLSKGEMKLAFVGERGTIATIMRQRRTRTWRENRTAALKTQRTATSRAEDRKSRSAPHTKRKELSMSDGETTTIFLTRAGFDLANTLLARGSFHNPIVVADIDCAALPELLRQGAAKSHVAPNGAPGRRVEMLVTEMNLDLAIRHKPA